MTEFTDKCILHICSELDDEYQYAVNQHGSEVLISRVDGHNPRALLVTSQDLKKSVRRKALSLKFSPSAIHYKQIESHCTDQSFLSEQVVDTYLRIAPIDDGFELDTGDLENTRIRVTAGHVEILTNGSNVLFLRPPSLLPFVPPNDEPDIHLLFPYLNFDELQAWLLIAWITFTLSHPKVDTTSFPILVLLADQGSGKSFLSRVIIRLLVDPSRLGIQGFPNSKQDMLLATQHAHLQVYDNLTYISRSWANLLCILSTSGNITNRQLYTNESIVNHKLHAPLVLNGISDFISTPDLAQRCLKLELNAMPDTARKSEKALVNSFQDDLPSIFAGCLKLSADVLKVLPDVTPTHSARMLDFMAWIAAIEQVMDLPDSQLQQAYHDIINESQYDAVMGDPLALAVYQLVTKDQRDSWESTPAALLEHLNTSMNIDKEFRSKSWPANAIALSKRLRTVKAALLSQHIEVVFSRGKERRITITNLDAY